jgi:phosphatidylglycerol:prolipoprotein diacylglycerol transferase
MLPHPGNSELVTSYGLMLVLALVVCWIWARRLAPVYGVERSHVDLAIPLIFLLSVVGARMLSASVYGTELDGLGVHATHVRFRLFGLLLFAAPLTFAYARLAGISARNLVDLLALPAVAWLVVLRIGCFLAGCCWGDVTTTASPTGEEIPDQVQTVTWLSGDWVPALSFPRGSYAFEQHLAFGLIDSSATSSLPVHVTQLYEMLLLSGVLVFLLKTNRSERPSGSIALVTLTSYALVRFPVEFVRADSVPLVMDLTATQLICIGLLALAFPASRALARSVA